MAVSSFPPVSGGGGGGASPLPGAVTEVVKGKFKLFATANIALEPGSYVATVLASSSGGTDLDSKKLTSKAVGSLKAGVTTLETVTESEAGVAFFAKPETEDLPLVSSPNSSFKFNGTDKDYAVNNYSKQYLYSFTTPRAAYIFCKASYQETTGVSRSGVWAFRTTNGIDWTATLQQNAPSNNSAWREPSFISYSDGMYRFCYSARSDTGYQFPIYYESSDGQSFSSTTLANTNQSTFYQTGSVPNVVYKYGGVYFFLSESGTSSKSMKLNGLSDTNATSIQDKMPNFNAGASSHSGFGTAAGSEYAWHFQRLFKTTDAWATYTSIGTDVLFGTTGFGTSWGDFGNGTYAVDNAYVAREIRISPDLVNWTTILLPSQVAGTLSSLFYHQQTNQWVANSYSARDIIAVSSGSANNWGVSGGHSTSGFYHYLMPVDASSGRVYGGIDNVKTIYHFIPGSTTMAAVAQPSWSQNMYSLCAASNESGTVTLIGGYGATTGSSNQMLVRATDGLNFTEVVSPFTSADNRITHLSWDQTNLQFTVGTLLGATATSPDGTTWTVRTDLRTIGESGINTMNARQRSKNGITHFKGRNNTLSRATNATLSDVARVQTQWSTSSMAPVYVAEEAGNTWLVMSTGSMFKQLSTTPTFDLANPIEIGLSFQAAGSGTRTPMKKVNGVWFAFASNGAVRYSSNFTTWQDFDADGIQCQDIEYDATNSRWVAIGRNSIAYSSDFSNWYGVTSAGAEEARNGLFVTDKYIGFGANSGSQIPAVSKVLSQTEEYGVLYYNSNLETL